MNRLRRRLRAAIRREAVEPHAPEAPATFDALAAEYPTWDAVKAAYPTFAALAGRREAN